MANLAFSDLLTECYTHLGLDSTNSTNIANVTRWNNYVQQDIVARWPWTFMQGRETVVTIPDYTTGTVSVSAAGTAVTGVSTAWTSTQGDGTYYIQFSSARDWYKVASRSSTTSITLDTAYAQTSNLSGGTYILRKFFYSLSSTADKILDIRNWNTPMKLVQVDPRTIDAINPNVQSTNSSYGYIAYGTDSSQNLVISPYPYPSDARLLEVRTYKRPTDGSISIPNKYAHVIAWGAIAVGFAFLRKWQEAAIWNKKFEEKIKDMQIMDRRSEDYAPILSAIDSGASSPWLSMGDQYPIIPGG